MGFYIFSYFQENRRLAYEVDGLNQQLKRSKSIISKYEKRYKTSHSNEQQYAQSNRDLQLNLATQGKHLVDLTQQLEREKTKLADAFLFYTQMKSLFGVSGEKDSHEQKVEPIVINSLKEKSTQWKDIVETHEVLKKNHTDLLKKGDKLKDEIENLHISHRNLQKLQVQTSNVLIEQKKFYGDLQSEYRNVTNAYNMQVAINAKLQKRLANCKLNTRNRNNDTTKAKIRKKMKNVQEGTELVEHNRKLADTLRYIENHLLKTEKTKSKVNVARTNTTINVKVVTPSNNYTRHQPSDSVTNLYNKGKGNTPVSQVPVHVKKVNTTISQNMPKLADQIRSLNKTTRLVQNTTAVTSKHIEKHETVPVREKQQTVKVMKTTIAPSMVQPIDNEDEVKEHLRRHKAVYEGDFDSEPKHDPPHIQDILDENGLSMQATAN